MKTKIFLDGGDPEETKRIIDTLGYLDGQTTNPTLIAKNPEAAKRLEAGEKFSADEILNFYKDIVTKISKLVPDGSVSIEVYSDANTKADEMVKQGREMNTWIPNAHIKLPTTKEGLKAANILSGEGIKINMTLVFTQGQAAAVYAATRGAKKGDVFLSPFIGRLDDRGENGMDLIKNILELYKKGDGHVEVLTASVRNMDHFLESLRLGSDIITSPAKIIEEWVKAGAKVPDENFKYSTGYLKPIPYLEMDLNSDWETFNIHDELTDKGIEKFSDDWNSLIK